jgi:D-alanyl-D-alanine dipeptidase
MITLLLSLLVPAFAGSEDFVNLAKYDFSIKEEIRYATPNNFTKKAVYPEGKCLLRKPVAEALSRVQANAKIMSLSLKVWDCYRPLSVQKKLWEIVHDDRYVADPAKGSKHNRGAAVDLTLVDPKGREVDMPTGFDDFSGKAHRGSKAGSKKAQKNMKLLEKLMASEGFEPYPDEWWHFDFKGWDAFPIEDFPLSSIK